MRQKRKKSRESVASVAKLWYYEWAPTERYRSGCGGIDSKCLEAPAVSSAENVRRTGLCAGSDFTISYRSCVFFLHSSKCSINIKDTWRGIEVVITGLTRNQFASNRTWVRIPPAAPRRSKLYIVCSDFFKKSERTHSAAPSFQAANAPLVCGLMRWGLWIGASFSST